MTTEGDTRQFPMRTARSPAIISAVCGVIVIETVVLHLWLANAHPWLAWVLTLGSVSTLLWLAGDYRALGHSEVTVHAKHVHLAVGWRASGVIPRDAVTVTVRPTWQERDEAQRAGAVNFTKPAEPNLLLTCTPPAAIRIAGGPARPLARLLLHLDDPDGFARAVQSPTTP